MPRRGRAGRPERHAGGFAATVDWPAAAFWPELREANPDAVVLLSERSSPDTWWDSFSRTIVPTLSTPVPPEDVAWTSGGR